VTMVRSIGITSTVPIEVVYGSGARVVDLNNVFIEDRSAPVLVERAERVGFPESSCAWIKGIYSMAHASDVDAVIAITQGDCSNTHALMETLEMEGVRTIAFMYPYDRDRRFLGLQIEKLMKEFDVTRGAVLRALEHLDGIRAQVAEIDRLTWETELVSGYENHYFQISCSDMKGAPDTFGLEVKDFLAGLSRREAGQGDMRLGYVGIPPILGGLYEFIESQGGRVVFNELQRQFSMPPDSGSLVDRYLAYTYPYHVRYRLEDIGREVRRRRIDGLIHYVQAFCFRQIEDIILRKEIDVPVLTIEGNRPGRIDLRTKVRIEAFLDMLRSRKRRA
jgi:benzoyl-CoA reductase/2-hydroxyglutaryl-CoA dehydratase subunit BcrC/BadD/HgdB